MNLKHFLFLVALKHEAKELIWIDPDSNLFDAIKILIQNKIHRLPVIGKAQELLLIRKSTHRTKGSGRKTVCGQILE